MNKLDIVYYFGIFGLISAVVAIMVQRFKEYDKINLKKHYVIVIIYILLLILSIILWTLFFDFIFGFTDVLNQNNSTYKSILNG